MEVKNLLIIDDEVLLLETLSILLKRYATNVYTAANGEEGLNILKNENIHCVICDISMPVMNGVELIKEVRALNNQVPFIFYTAHANHDNMREAAKYGAFDFLSKPLFDDVEAVVARGLIEGFRRTQHSASEPNYSVYQSILDELNISIKNDENT
jgi:YesN/AraC family two-component response regulator